MPSKYSCFHPSSQGMRWKSSMVIGTWRLRETVKGDRGMHAVAIPHLSPLCARGCADTRGHGNASLGQVAPEIALEAVGGGPTHEQLPRRGGVEIVGRRQPVGGSRIVTHGVAGVGHEERRVVPPERQDLRQQRGSSEALAPGSPGRGDSIPLPASSAPRSFQSFGADLFKVGAVASRSRVKIMASPSSASRSAMICSASAAARSSCPCARAVSCQQPTVSRASRCPPRHSTPARAAPATPRGAPIVRLGRAAAGTAGPRR